MAKDDVVRLAKAIIAEIEWKYIYLFCSCLLQGTCLHVWLMLTVEAKHNYEVFLSSTSRMVCSRSPGRNGF
jgi:hypothetical protein